VNGTLALLGWGALRIFGLLRAQTLWRDAVGPLWEGIAAALAICSALVLLPTASAEAVPLTRWLLIGACELLLGSVIGVLLSLPGAALLGAAGQSAAGLQLPRNRGLPLMLTVACLAGGLLAGVHRPLLLALRELLGAWPVGAPARWLPGLPALASWILGAGQACLVLALSFATPVLLSAATLDLGLRLASRGVAAPLLEVLRPWVVVVAALVALGAAWAAYPEAWLRAWPAL
jgi:type III secretory pathway component EscT